MARFEHARRSFGFRSVFEDQTCRASCVSFFKPGRAAGRMSVVQAELESSIRVQVEMWVRKGALLIE